MKMLLRLTPSSAGEVILWGKVLRGNKKKVLPRTGSMVGSLGFCPNLTGTENLHIFTTLRGTPKTSVIQDALTFVGLPYRDKKLFPQYSPGMKQRFALVLAITHDPELLILDKPINGLDPIGIAEVRIFIRDPSGKKGKAILFSSHILSEIALLAGDTRIIDQGVLLEEESFEELERRNNRHTHFIASDIASTALLSESVFQETHYTVQDDYHIILYNPGLPVERIISTHVENRLEVFEAHTYEETLEDYFKHVTGGEGVV